MAYSEEQYVERINSLQQEVDEDNDLLEQCYNRIKALELELQLANSSFTKKGLSEKKEEKYKEDIARLEEALSIFTSDMLDSKVDEVETLTKRVIAFRVELNKLLNKKHIRDTEVESLDKLLSGVSQDIATKLVGIVITLEELRKIEDTELDVESYINRIDSALGIVREVLLFRENEVIKLSKENAKLKNDILQYSGSETTYSDLLQQVSAKDAEIKNLKQKIKALEFRLENCNELSSDSDSII